MNDDDLQYIERADKEFGRSRTPFSGRGVSSPSMEEVDWVGYYAAVGDFELGLSETVIPNRTLELNRLQMPFNRKWNNDACLLRSVSFIGHGRFSPS
jgi:hypothetical protein